MPRNENVRSPMPFNRISDPSADHVSGMTTPSSSAACAIDRGAKASAARISLRTIRFVPPAFTRSFTLLTTDDILKFQTRKIATTSLFATFPFQVRYRGKRTKREIFLAYVGT